MSGKEKIIENSQLQLVEVLLTAPDVGFVDRQFDEDPSAWDRRQGLVLSSNNH